MQSPQSAPHLDVAKDPYGLEIKFAGLPDPASVVLHTSVLVRFQGQDVPGSLSWPSARVLRFEIEQPPFASGEYEVTVTDQVVSLVPGGAPGQRLDGEAGTKWPTGDGAPGGTFRFDFTVS
jgi:hypothetical protein